MLALTPFAQQRYAALFALRNKGGKDAVAALGEVFKARSALLKHEVAYVMGQMQHQTSTAMLTAVLKVSASVLWARQEYMRTENIPGEGGAQCTGLEAATALMNRLMNPFSMVCSYSCARGA